MKVDTFPLFLYLPAELRYMIIEEALLEEKHERVVLLDRQTHRVYPTQELAAKANPFLFVSEEFRRRALRVYTKVDVFDLGAPKAKQYGRERSWYMLPESFDYLGIDDDSDISQQIDREATNQGVHKGCMYINPTQDIFIVGIVPRLIAHSTPFRAITGIPIGPWGIPRDLVTAPLSESVRAKITTMREVEWDVGERDLYTGKCNFCGCVGFPCCTEGLDYLRGEDAVPFWLAYTSVSIESYGFYLLAAGKDMQKFFHDFTTLGGKACLEKWNPSSVQFDMGWLKDDTQ
ncbi:hypothetical protein Daus18300_010565 [Diaporthe australafricana]|uniref:2EXR domain-containing protein n=1 Tax=Diaporthe australafricana TaxID=127596 RepID=A0ABR3W9X6_9PEZI